jgi:SRSO17 transposase
MRYIQGLLRNGLRNKSIERIAEADSKDYYSLQHFISESIWKVQDLFSHTAKGVNKLIGGSDAALIFDESGMVKAGKASVGVERQYLGCVGKVENGQIGVFAALAHKGNYGIIDGELYLIRKHGAKTKRNSIKPMYLKDVGNIGLSRKSLLTC